MMTRDYQADRLEKTKQIGERMKTKQIEKEMTTKEEIDILFQEWQAMKERHAIVIAEWKDKTDRGFTLTESQAKKAIAIVTSQMAERDELKKRLKGI